MSRLSDRVRLLVVVLFAVALVACNDCDTKCKGGITFFVADLAGALSNGGKEPLHVCLDGDCHDVTVTHADAGGSVFLPFEGVGSGGDHDLTVTGVGALKGTYKGKLDSYTQAPGGDCKSCSLATVKIGADGTLTPAVPAPQATTTTVDAAVAPESGATTPAAG